LLLLMHLLPSCCDYMRKSRHQWPSIRGTRIATANLELHDKRPQFQSTLSRWLCRDRLYNPDRWLHPLPWDAGLARIPLASELRRRSIRALPDLRHAMALEAPSVARSGGGPGACVGRLFRRPTAVSRRHPRILSAS